ncbi:MAG: hypothetical protein LBK02_00550 [Treponema sp.]|jgi:hypothetical protein|nr:hypothetical protein [Treponema sp.]
MKLRNSTDTVSYRKVTEALKKQGRGATVADIVAATALPLALVRELVPQAADEYSARLEVTESGEIRYSFPRGFVSRYRGFRAGLKRFFETAGRLVKIAAAGLFKVWIMGMLLGYFALFMLLALASLFISAASRSSNSGNRRNNSGGGFYLSSSIFNLIIRLWFYSELTKSASPRYSHHKGRDAEKRRPLHRAIFSFVFGDGDPNRDWDVREKKSFIAYLQARRGLIALPEYMALSGLGPEKAEEELMARCSEFGGFPEAAEDGAIVYRFDELLLRTDREDRSFPDASAPIRRLWEFSSNSKKMNCCFGLVNTVNLIFGSYYLSNALNTGIILTGVQDPAGLDLYSHTYRLLEQFMVSNPLLPIGIGLGLVPLVFSLLFWLIPSLRYLWEKRENEKIKLTNLKKTGFGRIWSNPLGVREKEIDSPVRECRPRNMAAARDRIIKDMGAVAMPDVELDGQGNTVYFFKGLQREKETLEKYRASVRPEASALGKTVFDSDS